MSIILKNVLLYNIIHFYIYWTFGVKIFLKCKKDGLRNWLRNKSGGMEKFDFFPCSLPFFILFFVQLGWDITTTTSTLTDLIIMRVKAGQKVWVSHGIQKVIVIIELQRKGTIKGSSNPNRLNPLLHLFRNPLRFLRFPRSLLHNLNQQKQNRQNHHLIRHQMKCLHRNLYLHQITRRRARVKVVHQLKNYRK